MYNFLDPKLLPTVSTTAAAVEGYEADNLISPNHVTKARGFVAFTSITPPVNINFALICPISLRYISINAKVGTQKCTSIELLAKCPNHNEFTSIAQMNYIEEGVIFCNSRFYSKHNPPSNPRNFQLGYLKSHAFRSFINAKEIQVRILRTEWSVPCLGSVEIWGQISKSCALTTVKTVKHLINKNGIINECDEAEPQDDGNGDKVVKFDFPDDFKDALTFEIMAIPMTLPSGHTVDKSSLEKCVGNEANYGRQGSDPFTGLPFTDARKPVLNVGLKTRIDMYLLQNSHRKETFSVGRTVGVKRKIEMKSVVPIKRTIIDAIQCSSSNYISNDDGPSLSLEEAIAKATNSENFIRFTEIEKIVPEIKNECALCKVATNLYSLPCKHLFCRRCLLSSTKDQICKECKTAFSKKDVNKFHT
ncbi:PREDICTED: RING finger protein 37 [Nicrophorus vespilloides]|uniref:RING finger protein 37 n=1 Tax=Nicrophorus vespilloides TaxID=110193 RepID=A0ABM1MUP9_NICVS|nr:PREDICTED: RING finger protein 37 [Nicrophorus vespilloides]